jgi:glycosyltransferase involved in cell wall biosynthesis
MFRHLSSAPLRVSLVDLPAVTPPYDHALATALGRAGADVEVLTGEPLYADRPSGPEYRTVKLPGGFAKTRRARAWKLARLPLVLRTVGRHAQRADVVHYQWLGLEEVVSRLLPRKRPRVLTAHDIIPRSPRRRLPDAFRRLAQAMDAVVVHSEHGAERLRSELGVPDERIRMIPHGAFVHFTELPYERPLPDALARVEAPVVLCFGYMSHYKGVDVLLDALRDLDGVEAWIAGVPRVDLDDLRARAARTAATVRLMPTFVPDEELPALFRRADLVVLPYREIDQSGVLYTAMAFGRPMIVTRVGGLGEVADRHGAAIAVPPEDPDALAAAIARLVHDPAERERMAQAASRAAAGEYSWDGIAARHLELYRELTGGSQWPAS